MHPGTLVFLHGPLEGPGRWAGVADGLAPNGARVVAPDVVPTSPPFAVGWIAGAARPLHAAEPPEPLVLVGHGTAGPLLPALARTQRAARRQVGGYVFVDATLPASGMTSHLDLLRAADSAAAERLHAELHESPDERHAMWTEPLPPAVDWPDAPCSYVRTGETSGLTGPTEWWARSASLRGWWVDDSGRELAATLRDVIDRLPG